MMDDICEFLRLRYKFNNYRHAMTFQEMEKYQVLIETFKGHKIDELECLLAQELLRMKNENKKLRDDLNKITNALENAFDLIKAYVDNY